MPIFFSDNLSFARYNITIAAGSDALPPLVAYSHLMLSVMDDNDNEPVFDAQVYRGTVLEGLPASTRVVQGEYRVPYTEY